MSMTYGAIRDINPNKPLTCRNVVLRWRRCFASISETEVVNSSPNLQINARMHPLRMRNRTMYQITIDHPRPLGTSASGG